MHTYYENPKKHIFTSHRTKSYNFPSHFHNNLEITFCFSGTQTVRIGESSYDLKKNDVAFIFPNTVHEYIECSTANGEPTEVVAVIIDNKLIFEVMPEILSKFPKKPIVKSEFVSEVAVEAFKKNLECRK